MVVSLKFSIERGPGRYRRSSLKCWPSSQVACPSLVLRFIEVRNIITSVGYWWCHEMKSVLFRCTDAALRQHAGKNNQNISIQVFIKLRKMMCAKAVNVLKCKRGFIVVPGSRLKNKYSQTRLISHSMIQGTCKICDIWGVVIMNEVHQLYLKIVIYYHNWCDSVTGSPNQIIIIINIIGTYIFI